LPLKYIYEWNIYPFLPLILSWRAILPGIFILWRISPPAAASKGKGKVFLILFAQWER
jgi:hypothetical protein